MICHKRVAPIFLAGCASCPWKALWLVTASSFKSCQGSEHAVGLSWGLWLTFTCYSFTPISSAGTVELQGSMAPATMAPAATVAPAVAMAAAGGTAPLSNESITQSQLEPQLVQNHMYQWLGQTWARAGGANSHPCKQGGPSYMLIISRLTS